jgi:hypothetical protein
MPVLGNGLMGSEFFEPDLEFVMKARFITINMGIG